MVLPDFRSPRRFPAADPARPPPPVECPAPSRAAPRLRPPVCGPLRPVPARPGMPPRPVAARAAPVAGRSAGRSIPPGERGPRADPCPVSARKNPLPR